MMHGIMNLKSSHPVKTSTPYVQGIFFTGLVIGAFLGGLPTKFYINFLFSSCILHDLQTVVFFDLIILLISG